MVAVTEFASCLAPVRGWAANRIWRYGWEWAIAAVGTDCAVALLDRTKAKRGAAFSLGPEATVENLLAWLEEGRAT